MILTKKQFGNYAFNLLIAVLGMIGFQKQKK